MLGGGDGGGGDGGGGCVVVCVECVEKIACVHGEGRRDYVYVVDCSIMGKDAYIYDWGGQG